MNTEIKNECSLIIKYEHTQPIPLEDYQKALFSLNKQFNKYSKKRSEKPRLSIKEIRKGSIETELIVVTSYAIVQYVPYLNDFINYIKPYFDWFLEKITIKPQMNISDIKDIANITKPVNSGNGNISINIAGDVNAPINISTAEAGIIEKNCNNELEKEEENVVKQYDNVLLKFKQIHDDINNKNTKGIIAIIDKRVLPIMMPPAIRNEIIDKDFFEYSYLVNVDYYKKDKICVITELLDKTRTKENGNLFNEEEN